VIATHVRRDGTVVCMPLGELDLSSSVSLRHLVDDAWLVGYDIVIDLTRVRHIDATGLTVIFKCMRRVRSTGGTVRVVNLQPQVRRSIEVVTVTGATGAPARADSHDAA
jgi:anti-anti-sigma factor